MEGGRFSSVDSAFAVFRYARLRHGPFRRVLTFYVLAAFILFIPAGALILNDLAHGRPPSMFGPDPDPAFEAANLTSFLMWPVAAAAEAALLRWMLRGEPGGRFLGVRFGVDELKILVIQVLIMLAVVAAVLAGGIAAGLSAVVFGLAGVPAVAVLMAVVAGLAGVGAALFLVIRFSPAAALTIREGRFRFFEAWRVSQQLFWPLLGAHVLRIVLTWAASAALAVALTIVGLIVMAPVLGWVFGLVGGASDLAEAPPYAWAGAGTVFVLGFALFSALEFVRLAMAAGISVEAVWAHERSGAVAEGGDSL